FRKKGIASKRLFSRNTSSKSHGRRQPCRGFSSCLASKTSLFEVLCSFAPEIFSHAAALRAQEYFVSFKAEKQGVGKKIGVKPNPFLWNVALGLPLFSCPFVALRHFTQAYCFFLLHRIHHQFL
ncbi:MAG: hypothetical protein IKL99_02535, partial [Oscillospiraceae bacterium]|nr:hypothetical protein [Oscillospiraceae bacterium]